MLDIPGYKVLGTIRATGSNVLFHAMREAGKIAQALLQHLAADAERQHRRRGAGGILRVVAAAQRADAADVGDFAAGAARGAYDRIMIDADAVRQRALH